MQALNIGNETMTPAALANHGLFGRLPPFLDGGPPPTLQFSPQIPGSAILEDAVPGSLAGMIMYASAGTIERRHDLACMLRALAPRADFTVLAGKDMGGARLRAELAGFGCDVVETAKRHHRICVGVSPDTLIGIDAAVADGAPRRLSESGLWSQPGIFSWNRVDPGTALLLDALPLLSGRGADLGCGIGVMAHGVLASAKVTGLHLVDIDRRAVEAARRNVDDPRVTFSWADVRHGLPVDGLDFVVSNPPFHNVGLEDRALGTVFIEQSAKALRSGGQLWMVANRHLPYERVLSARFRRVTSVIDGHGFKVFSALK